LFTAKTGLMGRKATPFGTQKGIRTGKAGVVFDKGVCTVESIGHQQKERN